MPDADALDEFELIQRYFAGRRQSSDVVIGIGDDAAVVDVDAGRQVQAIDTLISGVHFPEDLPADDVGWRAVAVNLSDIAAMGAEPRWMTLALTLPQADAGWLEAFATGFFAAADEFDVVLIGGDTTRGPVTTLSIAVTGVLPPGARALLRSTARTGDGIFVSGHPGEAAGGLREYAEVDASDALRQRFARPRPRFDVAREIAGVATAAIDVSDGLLADARRLLSASGVGGNLVVERLPLSAALTGRFDLETSRELALSGGDDYELCFTAPAGSAFRDCTEIGRVTDGEGLQCTLDGRPHRIDASGYRHFQQG